MRGVDPLINTLSKVQNTETDPFLCFSYYVYQKILNADIQPNRVAAAM